MASISALDAGGVSPGMSPQPLEYYDDEPDEEWKKHRKEIIEDGFKPMIQEAKDRLERKIQSLRARGETEEDEERERVALVDEFRGEAAAMKALAKEEFEHALARERLQRRLRRDLPPAPAPMSRQSLRLDLEQEQAATLRAAMLHGGSLEGDAINVEATFRNLIDPSSSPTDDRTEDRTEWGPNSDTPSELELDEGEAPGEGTSDGDAIIDPGAGALTIKITRLPAEPPFNGNVGWVKASDAARRHELAVRQRANSRTEVARVPSGPPPEPPKKWVSASDAARRATHRRIESQGA
ncbi:hypothetical protein B0H15DRAFT_843157 [Mycena belliarum]|uniref:Uncharacterized protein n=1 Tax=Mycena belliarum TaxID=1033014 RepID=A0AAD6U4W8_9AGAR|nr:hypothetical protein B0H15DRAFT_843157 [Mycena belliae]